jgi:TonB-linked SusC/RagA family outer membrane protein
MKKNERSKNKTSHSTRRRKWQKLILVMKLTLCLFVFFNFSMFAGVFSQTKLTLSVKEASVEQILQKISTSSDYYILYNQADVQGVGIRTIDVKDANIETILDLCLENSHLTYVIKDNTIIISEKKVGEKKSMQQQPTLITIIGKVVDKSGAPLPGVTVYSKETKKGVTTDAMGQYSIRLNSEDKILVFSFIGMTTKEVSIEGKLVINVTLEDAIEELNQVVVTGIFNRKKETYTGSDIRINSEDLVKMGTKNLVTSLRNFDPSINIVESNLFGSDPNRLLDIQIRGNSSLPNVNELKDETRAQLNTPLIILDGFESSLRKLMDLDETEVEAITILKDASATAIYGSRGANGVIVITTKPPKMGKLTLTYRGGLDIEAPDLSTYDLLNAKQKLELEYLAGKYTAVRADDDVMLKRYYNFLLNEVNSGVDTYWLSKPVRVGYGQRHSMRLEGGDASFRYSASIQYTNKQGVMKESSRDVINGNINLSYTYNRVRFINQLSIGSARGDNSPYGSFEQYVRLNPYFRSHDENGEVIKLLGLPPEGISYKGRWSQKPVNPLYNASLNVLDYNTNSDVNENLEIIWDVLPGMKFTGSAGLTKAISQNHLFLPAEHTNFESYIGDDFFRKGSYDYSIGNNLNYSGRLNLSYNKTIKTKHFVSSGIDYSLRSYEGSLHAFSAEGFPNERLDFMSAALQYAVNKKPSGSETLSRSIGIVSFINYSYDEKYFVDFTYRLDGSSQFGASKRWAPFWSSGLGWNLHKEAFFKELSFINRLKLKGSVGITGSQNFNPYQALSTYRYITDDRYYSWVGVNLMGLGNKDLRWQQTKQYNIGLESQLFDNRLQFVADYYIKTTDGMISSINIPLANGFSSYVSNIGAIENKGFELRSTVMLIRDLQRKLSWSVTASAAHNKNKITELSQALKDAQKELELMQTSNPNRFYREGESVSAIYAVRSLGIDPSNGKEVYLDRFGNTTYTWNGLDQVSFGDTEPFMYGSINSSVRYRNLSLNLSFGYRFGGQQYNNTLMNKVENVNFDYNVDSRVYKDRWQNPGDIASFKGLLVTTPTYNTSRFVQDENTFTCQNINLTYELHSDFLSRNTGLRVLNLTGNFADLFYFSSVKRERGTTYPFARTFSMGISTIF